MRVLPFVFLVFAAGCKGCEGGSGNPGDRDRDGIPDSADTSIDTGPLDTAADCVATGPDDNCNGVDDDCDGLVDGGHRVPGDYDSIDRALRHDANALVCLAAGSYPGPVALTGAATIQGAGEGATIIEGSGPAVLMFAGGALRDLTVRGGEAEVGAGVRVDGGDAALERVTITGNRCLSAGNVCAGAGLAVLGGSATLSSVTVAANEGAVNQSGRVVGLGVYVNGAGLVANSSTVSDNVLYLPDDAEVPDAFGLGIALAAGATATLQGVDVLRNSIDTVSTLAGAGVYVDASTLDMSQGWIAGNYGYCRQGNGGGLLVYAGSATLTNVVVVQNRVSCSATATGGGAAVDAGVLSGSNLVLAGNVAEATTAEGGALHLAGGGAVALVNSVLYANTASSLGASGGAASGTGTLSLSYADVYANAPSASLYGSIEVDGSTVLEVDPLFVDTDGTAPGEWDLHLSPGSPLVDAGDPAVLDADGSRSDVGVFGGPEGSW